jgi:hypothetical protein
MPHEPFADVVADKLAFLLSEHGFRVTEAGERIVVLETPVLCVQAVRNPRGEVEINVFRLGRMHAGMWTYSGMEMQDPPESTVSQKLAQRPAPGRHETCGGSTPPSVQLPL